MFETVNNRLIHNGNKVDFQKSPHFRGSFQPKYIIIHCTEGTSLQGSIDWMKKPDTKKKGSAHLVIGKDSKIVQMVDFNLTAFHTGHAEWRGRRGLDKFCFGIELDNPGLLTRGENHMEEKVWKKVNRIYDDADVVKAKHFRRRGIDAWLKYPLGQVFIALEICRFLIAEYNLVDLLAHDEIADKTDPGPAFDLLGFRKILFGREEALLPWWEELPAENE